MSWCGRFCVKIKKLILKTEKGIVLSEYSKILICTWKVVAAARKLKSCCEISIVDSSRDVVGHLLLTSHKALRSGVNVYLLPFIES